MLISDMWCLRHHTSDVSGSKSAFGWLTLVPSDGLGPNPAGLQQILLASCLGCDLSSLYYCSDIAWVRPIRRTLKFLLPLVPMRTWTLLLRMILKLSHPLVRSSRVVRWLAVTAHSFLKSMRWLIQVHSQRKPQAQKIWKDWAHWWSHPSSKWSR